MDPREREVRVLEERMYNLTLTMRNLDAQGRLKEERLLYELTKQYEALAGRPYQNWEESED